MSRIKYKRIFDSASGGGSGVQSVNSGTGINVDNTDPQNPIVNSTITQAPGYTIQIPFSSTAQAPADSTTYYFGSGSVNTLVTTADIRNVIFPKAATIKAATVFFNQTAGASNETSTIYIRLNNTTDTVISNAVVNNATKTSVSNFALSIAVNGTTDYIEIKWVTPVWGTNPLAVTGQVILYLE